jgi:methylase of polypeptide subunit release factors
MTGSANPHPWLDTVEQSGPFLTLPVLKRVWPSGMPVVPTGIRAEVRRAVEELLSTKGSSRAPLERALLARALDWGQALRWRAEIPATLAAAIPEHGLVLRPDFAFFAEDESDEELAAEPEADDDETALPGASGPWRALGLFVPFGAHPFTRRVEEGFAASPIERLGMLLRETNVPVGLVSDGRWWAVVWAERGRPLGAGLFDASLFSEEPETLRAFVALFERRRFLGVSPQDRLSSLFAESLDAQEEVTDALGGQVRAAVERLVRRFDELDRAEGGAPLAEVSDEDLYAGAVTVLMRVVFLLFAEERRLLPSDDARYDAAYAVSSLVESLEQRAAIHGRQTLAHRTGAWHRLLALARALHAGVAHEDLRLPPYGGSLFDPDRFPFLEGEGTPPAIDDLTVLEILQAVQYVTIAGERRRLSFRTLDVEQIGYVYEGLLEREVETTTEPVLTLRPRGKRPLGQLGLADALEKAADPLTFAASTYQGEARANATRLRAASRWLAEEAPPTLLASLAEQLGADVAARLAPLAPLLATDERGRALLTPAGGRSVVPSRRRVVTGAHYTPRSLTEEVVRHTLEPLCYRPGPLETLDRDAWVLRPSSELVQLRIADIAMGSGAFLVATARFLADRLVEAWAAEGEAAAVAIRAGISQADAEAEGLLLDARRLVVEHCLYGVDVNPLAVEMAKLSLWLVTMDRERPFSFLDDRLVCGDSLLGVASLAELEHLELDSGPDQQVGTVSARLDLAAPWRARLARAADTRRRITARPVVTVRDVEVKARLLDETAAELAPLRLVADALLGTAVAAARTRPAERRSHFVLLEHLVAEYEASGSPARLDALAAHIDASLPKGREPRRPLHWPLAFPEVFADSARPGFDAIVGNPPFLGGQRISGTLGSDYLAVLRTYDGRGVRGSADLAARFLLRADRLLTRDGQLGYVATNTTLEGDTLEVGLLQLEARGWRVRRGTSPHPWPSRSASLSIVELWATKAPLRAEAVLDDEPVGHLTVDLQPYLTTKGRPDPLAENEGIAFQGSIILGLGFTMSAEEAQAMIAEDPRNAEVLFPYVIGADLNRRPDCSASRWIVNFHDWPEERAAIYPAPFERVRRLVKPERDRNTMRDRRENWWLYASRASQLYARMASLDHVLAISRVGNTLLPVRVATGPVFSEACVVFALADLASLAVLSSSAHQAWVLRYTSTLETRVRYAPSDVFLTFPRPAPTDALEQLGRALDDERRAVMARRALGLTKLYNLVHNPTVRDADILRLRSLHAEIDAATLAAYGWSDLDPEIGHHRTKIGLRWTLSRAARLAVLDRLLLENHRRAGRA